MLSPKLLAGPRLLWRRQLRAISDPQLRARCVPDYVMGCKRVVFSNDWYPTLSRPEVALVTDRVERIVPGGVVAGGTLRPADVIIYGTGFRTTEFLAPMSVTGLGGQRLDEAWRDGAEAYLGITVAGFPNFFLLYGPNTNLGGNSIIYMLEGQIRYVAGALRALREQRLRWLTVRPEVQAEFDAWVRSASATSVWETGCHNWYTTASGRNTSNWPVHTFIYRHRVRHFDLSQYTVMPARTSAPRTCRRSRMNVRVPPALVRLGARQVSRRVANPRLPWEVQRRRLDKLVGLMAAAAWNIGHEDSVERSPGLVVTACEARPAHSLRWHRPGNRVRQRLRAVTVVHFHGGGYCAGSPAEARNWAAHLTARTGCRRGPARVPAGTRAPISRCCG